MNTIRKLACISSSSYRNFSVSTANNATYSCKLLVVGGGSGGITIASKFVRRLQAKDSVIILEPSKDHYYQPLYTLVAAGVTDLKTTHRYEQDLIPAGAKWIQDYAACINPDNNSVTTKEGHTINYEYIVVAVGLEMNYDKVPGILDALKDPRSGVSTIYTQEYCVKTWNDLQSFKGGDAIFTFPNCPIKCPGAPQKIAYMADAYFTKKDIRSKANISYVTCTPVIFGVKKYAVELEKVAKRKNIDVNYKLILKEIHHDEREAVFHRCDDVNDTVTKHFDLLHVVPHQHPNVVVRENRQIADEHGFLDVDMHTLQHKKYPNMYGIGDCTNTPNSKTGAAVAKQCYVLEHNLLSTMKKDSPKEKYDGYGACPLVTSYNTCILAEFVYGGVPHETMPYDQSKESHISFYMKRHLFPFIYWNFMLKGYYHGPEFVRKIINPMGW